MPPHRRRLSLPGSRSGDRSRSNTVNIPDTVGYSMPENIAISCAAGERVAGHRQVTISTHCHNDLGWPLRNSTRRSASRRAPGESPSTALASAPVTRLSKKSSWPCGCVRSLSYETAIAGEHCILPADVRRSPGFRAAAKQGHHRPQCVCASAGIHRSSRSTTNHAVGFACRSAVRLFASNYAHALARVAATTRPARVSNARTSHEI